MLLLLKIFTEFVENMPHLMKRENPVWEAFMGSYVLLTRKESTWQQMVFINALITEKTIWLQPWSWSKDTNPKANKMSLILLLMPSLFRCQMRLCFMRFNSNLSEINISEIIPFWLFKVQKWPTVEILRQTSEEYCETIYSLNHYHSIIFPHVVFSIQWKLFCSLLEWWV